MWRSKLVYIRYNSDRIVKIRWILNQYYLRILSSNIRHSDRMITIRLISGILIGNDFSPVEF